MTHLSKVQSNFLTVLLKYIHKESEDFKDYHKNEIIRLGEILSNGFYYERDGFVVTDAYSNDARLVNSWKVYMTTHRYKQKNKSRYS